MRVRWQKMQHELRVNLSYDTLTCEPDVDILSMLQVQMTVETMLRIALDVDFHRLRNCELGKADNISKTTM